jgi:diadenosine tetraphosphatase ApaH/serine/threonine PP2A family protein phosphatase
VAEHADLCLAGNHDLAVLGSISLADFSGDAGTAARWTREVLDAESHAFLAQLEPAAERPGIQLFHGSPLDPVWDYVLSEEAAVRSFRATSAPLVLVGHSHVALALTAVAEGVAGGLAPGGSEVPLRERTLLNPGSVGQPRDGDPRAAYLVIDEATRRATFWRVPYPIEETQAEIRARGLPEPLATRLATGV